MVIVISKKSGKKQIADALKQLQKNKNNIALADFYGKLKGQFGEGIDYQRKIRDEWDY